MTTQARRKRTRCQHRRSFLRIARDLHERLATPIQETHPGGCCSAVALALSAARDLFARVKSEHTAHARTREIGAADSVSRPPLAATQRYEPEYVDHAPSSSSSRPRTSARSAR